MKFFYIIILLFFNACAINEEIKPYKINENIQKDLNVDVEKDWHKLYNQNYLNKLINKALKENKELKIASLSTLQAFARAGVLSANLLPNLNASYQGGVTKNLKTKPSSTKDKYGYNLSASYEVDLFSKISDEINSASFLAKKSVFDKESLRQSVINSVIGSYFKELFINDAVRILEQNLQNQNKLHEILNLKYKLGKVDKKDILEVEKSTINLKNRLLSYKKERFENQKLLRDLLFLNNRDKLDFEGLFLKDVKLIGVDLNVSFEVLKYRPDLNSLISQINSSFYDYKVSKKAFYPSISIGSALSSNADSFDRSFDPLNLSANISLNLPFLNYKRLNEKLKISKIEFEKRVQAYKQRLLECINELHVLNKSHQIFLQNLKYTENIVKKNSLITELEKVKYENGKSELKDYLNSQNSLLSSLISLLEQKHSLLKNEIAIYKSLSGRVKNSNL